MGPVPFPLGRHRRQAFRRSPSRPAQELEPRLLAVWLGWRRVDASGMLVGTMAKKKPMRVEPARQGEARKRGPKGDLQLCILYLITYGGSSLEELAEATGMDPDTVDRYMVGQEPVSREL